MTDDAPDNHDDDRVRALLGSLGAAEPIPPEVAARIESALSAEGAAEGAAERAAEGAAEQGPEPVAPGSRARSRMPRRWLAAAAALVILGGGGAVLVHHLDGSGNSAASTSADSERGPMTSPGSGEQSTQSLSPSSSPAVPGPQLHGRIALPTLTTAHFASGVHSLLSHRNFALAPLAGAGMPYQPSPGKPDCTRPAGIGDAPIIEISLDGRLSQLVVTGSGSDRVATAYDCAGTRRLATAAAPG